LSATWFQIETPTAELLPTSTSCATACSSCDAVTCVAGVPIVGLGPDGVTRQWDGRVHPHSMCTTQSLQVPCFETGCAPAGHYIAQMCAFECVGGNTVCTKVGFDYPGTPQVTGTLPGIMSGDGGAAP
jgi:hypothetical protein